MNPQKKQHNAAVLKKFLKVEGVAFIFAGAFLSLKKHFTDLVFLDAESDFYLGVALIFVGIANFIIVEKFFSTEKHND